VSKQELNLFRLNGKSLAQVRRSSNWGSAGTTGYWIRQTTQGSRAWQLAAENDSLLGRGRSGGAGNRQPQDENRFGQTLPLATLVSTVTASTV
jgi:hypothetical protein